MIERIAVAERQYERIMLDVISRSNPQAWIDFPVREIKAWLQDDVVPLIDQFRLGPMFRDHASWTLKTLVAGSVSVERRAVEATDRALVESAASLLQLAQSPLVQRKLAATESSENMAAANHVYHLSGRWRRDQDATNIGGR